MGKALKSRAVGKAGSKKNVARSTRSGKVVPAKKAAEKAMQKTSVYLDAESVSRLVELARRLGRPQSQIIREAIGSYEPSTGGDRNFALAGGFDRVDGERRPISEIPKRDLLRGFGE